MFDFIAAITDQVHENVDERYLKVKNEGKEATQATQMISAAVLVTSVAITIFGFHAIASGSFVGLPAITIGLLQTYLSYNFYKFSENADAILDNQKKYQNLFGLEGTFNHRALKNKLAEGTFCFSWWINYIPDRMAHLGLSRNFTWIS